jgi:hypothetical protein
LQLQHFIAGAAHFMIASHADEVARAIATHVHGAAALIALAMPKGEQHLEEPANTHPKANTLSADDREILEEVYRDRGCSS